MTWSDTDLARLVCLALAGCCLSCITACRVCPFCHMWWCSTVLLHTQMSKSTQSKMQLQLGPGAEWYKTITLAKSLLIATFAVQCLEIHLSCRRKGKCFDWSFWDVHWEHNTRQYWNLKETAKVSVFASVVVSSQNTSKFQLTFWNVGFSPG